MPVIMQLYDYDYPVEDLQLLLDLLKAWKFEFLYQTLVDELIDIEVLQIIHKDHINELISNFPIGITAKFTHKLQEWQKCNSIENLNSTSGKMILDYYKINNKFNNSIRALLVDSIISYIIIKQIPMSVNLASIGLDIVKMFQSEVKDTYFMKDGLNKNSKGNLYAKYYNSMRTFKASGLVPIKEPPVKTISHSRHDIEFEPEDDINNALDKIMFDDNCAFPELQHWWKQTTKHRLCEIQKHFSTVEILQK